jgi:hypothetical protein
MNQFSGEDLIFYKENDKIMSGGYLINSILLNQGLPAMTTLNQNYYGGQHEKVSSIFENLAVPAGLFYMNTKTEIIKNQPLDDEIEHVPLTDDLHDQLFALIEMKPIKKNTRKKSILKPKTSNKISRKNKNSGF